METNIITLSTNTGGLKSLLLILAFCQDLAHAKLDLEYASGPSSAWIFDIRVNYLMCLNADLFIGVLKFLGIPFQ